MHACCIHKQSYSINSFGWKTWWWPILAETCSFYHLLVNINLIYIVVLLTVITVPINYYTQRGWHISEMDRGVLNFARRLNMYPQTYRRCCFYAWQQYESLMLGPRVVTSRESGRNVLLPIISSHRAKFIGFSMWIKIQQMQQYADIYSLQNYSTCFGCHSTHHQEY